MELANSSEDTTQLRSIIGALTAGNNVLLTGPGGCGKCLSSETPVLKYDGSVVRAFQLAPGDILIGDDSKPRTIYSTARGYGKLYKVSTNYGDSYVVNDEHILTLKQAHRYVIHKKSSGVFVYFPEEKDDDVVISKVGFKYKEYKDTRSAKLSAKFFCHALLDCFKSIVVDIPIENYRGRSRLWKYFFQSFKVPVEYPPTPYEINNVDPYYVGLMLNEEITGKELSYSANLHVFHLIASNIELSLSDLKNKACIKGATRIPLRIFTTSLDFRKKVLAAICDEIAKYKDGVLYIKSNLDTYLKDVERLCRSVGLAAYIHHNALTYKYTLRIWGQSVWKTIPSENFGDVNLKPLPILRTTIQDVGLGYYYGFVITDNGRFLLGNYCVTHNTHTLKAIATHFFLSKDEIACTATTGVAALGLTNDDIPLSPQTFHSWAGIGLGDRTAKAMAGNISRTPVYISRWESIEYLIIDEVSMLSAELLDKVEEVARLVRKRSAPFGGIKLILSGDFLQLPPVKGEFAFTAKCWDRLCLVPFVFKIPKRYDDIPYFDLLLRIRQGTHTAEDMKKLRARRAAHDKLREVLEKGNATAIKPTIMYSTRTCVNHYNITELNKLTSPPQTYAAYDEFKPANPKREEYYKSILDQAIPPEITLKIGAQVMLKANLNLRAGLVNGSRGVVEGLSVHAVTVRFVNGVRAIILPHAYSVKEDKTQAIRTQIPLILAWALTIHKSQGVTLDFTICDIGRSVFEAGQAYVALSRVRNLKGLFLSNFDYTVLRANKLASDYTQKLEGNEKHEPKYSYVPVLEEHLRRAKGGKTKVTQTEDAWGFWIVENKSLPYKEWKDVLDMGVKEGYNIQKSEELHTLVTAKINLASRTIYERSDWKKWLLINHVDKGGDLEECKLVINYGKIMDWTQ